MDARNVLLLHHRGILNCQRAAYVFHYIYIIGKVNPKTLNNFKSLLSKGLGQCGPPRVDVSRYAVGTYDLKMEGRDLLYYPHDALEEVVSRVHR